MLKNEGIKSEFFHGELEEAQRDRLIKRLWRKDVERIDVLVSTDAAYVGLNLQIADTIIHHDLSWNPMVVEQRIGRIHRIGQKKQITSHSFLCGDTIDQRKHEILTEKLEEISTHLGMSYSVVLSEVAISSEIEKLMAQFELKEIEEKTLREKLKRHITERKEIFELLQELPSGEAEIVQIGFTNDLIQKMEDIVGEIIKLGKKTFDIRIQPIIEDSEFMVLDYEKDGKRVKELSTLYDKALLSVKPEKVNEWKEKYKFENLEPSYLGLFHPVIEKAVNVLVEQNFSKFWRKKVTDIKQTVFLYLLIPLKIKNLTAEIETNIEIFAPVLYEPEKKEIKIDAAKTYQMVCSPGKIEELSNDDMEVLKEAQAKLNMYIENIRDKIRADIEKVKKEIEELALQKHGAEIERKMEEKRKKLEFLNSEINRKRNAGENYDKQMREAKNLKKEIDELQKGSEAVPESGLIIEFQEHKIAGGCIYVS